ncbi:class I adenylate-forming enzyme family protein [Nonomuraea africana]|uniref:Acyl-CoA synthetase (AMP-forming)/AMP-acid ligase II n=1 Tax=Nonomuraea africana TaxID=46171 RepID=A0ABR9KKL5_9ACTN|nr:class I adenylate-forming enzyme family protein [Nonomuraea africana]MBE1562561.1 acyl-CoA synthetase (AMP-forming)/AMP-acid ligase II [Nonomuraea africana]
MLRLLAGEAARRFGARAAVESGTSRLSFADLDRLSDQVAAGLSHRGVRVGDVLALVLPDGPEFVVCYLAAAKIGAVTAGLDARHPARLALLSRLDPDLVVTAPRLLPSLPGRDVVTLPTTLPTTLPASPPTGPTELGDLPPASWLGALARNEPPPPPMPPDPGRPVVITHTSGRTGPPKAALFGDRQLEAIRAHGAGVRWGRGDARLLSHPMGHLAFATRLPLILQTGRTTYLLPSWDPESALRLACEKRLRVLQGTPAQLAAMLDLPGKPPSFELVLSTGGPAPPGLIRRLREHFGAPVCNRYLCTEAGLGLGTRPDDPPQDAELTVGRPRAGVDLSVRDSTGRPLPAGEEGEVLLRSQAVMSGYVGDGDPRVFARDGFVRTGDTGFLDDLGRLHLVGTQSRS